MIIAKGDAVDYGLNEVVGAKPQWPHAFVRLNLRPEELIESLQSNHVHAVDGDYREELVKLCRMLDVEPMQVGD